jgi:GNAT superfamily N-acetyltransferase
MKKIIINKREWDDGFVSTSYTCVEKNEVLYSFDIETFLDSENNDCNFISNLYVQPKHREKGYFYNIMNLIFELCTSDIYLKCRKDNSISKKYVELGFELFGEDEDEDENERCYVYYQKESEI